MLFQLIIDGENTKIILNVPDTETFERYINNPGAEGYKLYEIISVITGGYSKISGKQTSNTCSDDSLIQFNIFE